MVHKDLTCITNLLLETLLKALLNPQSYPVFQQHITEARMLLLSDNSFSGHWRVGGKGLSMDGIPFTYFLSYITMLMWGLGVEGQSLDTTITRHLSSPASIKMHPGMRSGQVREGGKQRTQEEVFHHYCAVALPPLTPPQMALI